MYARLLVPLDQSPVATRAVPFALTLAQAFKARVTLLSVIEPVSFFRGASAVLDDRAIAINEAETQARERAAQHLESVAGPFRAAGVDVTTVTWCGIPDQEIITAARENADTLLVMSTHGQKGIGRPWYSSVTRHIIRHAGVPTFIVPGGEERGVIRSTVSQVVVTLDGSPLARAALPVARHFAETLAVPLVLLRVVPNLIVTQGFYYDPTFLGQWQQDDEQAAREELAEVSASLVPTTCPVASVVIQAGTHSVDERIHCFMDAQPGNLLVMASHGRSGVLRWALGSTTEGVLGRATYPVLVVPAATNAASGHDARHERAHAPVSDSAASR